MPPIAPMTSSDRDADHAPPSPSICHACPLQAAARSTAARPAPKPGRGAGRVHSLGRCPRLDARKPRFGFARLRSLGRRPHPAKRGATSRAGRDGRRGSAARAALRTRGSLGIRTLTRRPGQQIIVCCPFACLYPIPSGRTPYMNITHKLGLTLVAAALVTVYGCGKEEPKKAEAPEGGAAAARRRNRRRQDRPCRPADRRHRPPRQGRRERRPPGGRRSHRNGRSRSAARPSSSR